MGQQDEKNMLNSLLTRLFDMSRASGVVVIYDKASLASSQQLRHAIFAALG